MIGESVMVHPRVSPSSLSLFARIAIVVRRLTEDLRAKAREGAIPKPFPFFGE